ncbi:MAG: prepilin-type N-terminal cleavage/methylation domain-containing protein [Deltaproteobacteria bacterium]|nr:prepilin-type N-terminal cleavage/methylation domain-containing protein [Deltaproteobacteria bacterium]
MKTPFADCTKNADKLGFTLVEMLVSTIIVAFVAAGIWGVYWSVVNTYYVEQRSTNIQAEGERILDLIANGGWVKGRSIYGLSSSISNDIYPNVGGVTSYNFAGREPDSECPPGCTKVYRPDYRIEFMLDSVSGHTRFAEFAVELYACLCGGEVINYATSKLWFRVKTSDISDYPSDYNYDVLISENVTPRKSGENPTQFGDYDMTWFKAQKLASAVSGYCTGVKVSYYLDDTSYKVRYNCDLDRELTSPTGNPDQDRSYMNGLPYPRYFSTTVSLPQRGD